MSDRRRGKGNKRSLFSFAVSLWILNQFIPLRHIGTVIFGGIVCAFIAIIVKIMASGLDTTTHNRERVDQEKPSYYDQINNRPAQTYDTGYGAQEQPRTAAQTTAQRTAAQQRRSEPEIAKSGNEQADATVQKGLEMIRRIREENAAIPEQRLTEQMDRLEELCLQIFRTVSEKPAKAPQIRKFMNYYLPTTLNMLANYRTMKSRGVSRENLQEVRETLERALDMVNDACQKQLDNMYQDNKLDVTTDIEVLEQMLVRDGLVDAGPTILNTEARTAAAQMANTPTLFSEEVQKADEEFDSFYRSRYENH